MDLTRFAGTTVKKAKLVDLMSTKCFSEAVKAYDGDIDDTWIILTVHHLLCKIKAVTCDAEIKNSLYLQSGIEALKEAKKESYFLSKANQYLKRNYAELYSIVMEGKCEV